MMESQHMTQQSFANYIDITPGTLSGIFTGRTNPTLKTVEAIHSKFPNLNLEWLLYGKGSMFVDDGAAPASQDVGSSAAQSEARLDFQDTLTPPAEKVQRQESYHGVSDTPLNGVRYETKYIDKPQRKITEIRIFYDDQTWESFVPKKG